MIVQGHNSQQLVVIFKCREEAYVMWTIHITIAVRRLLLVIILRTTQGSENGLWLFYLPLPKAQSVLSYTPSTRKEGRRGVQRVQRMYLTTATFREENAPIFIMKQEITGERQKIVSITVPRTGWGLGIQISVVMRWEYSMATCAPPRPPCFGARPFSFVLGGAVQCPSCFIFITAATTSLAPWARGEAQLGADTVHTWPRWLWAEDGTGYTLQVSLAPH